MQQIYHPLLLTHSLLRYVVLILLLAVIAQSLSGWLGKKNFTKADEKLPLFLLISAHLQLLLGLALAFASPFVKLEKGIMKAPVMRYWTVEHISMMILAVILITVAKSSIKRLNSSESKFKRLFIFNTIALVIIVVTIMLMTKAMGQGFFQVRGL